MDNRLPINKVPSIDYRTDLLTKHIDSNIAGKQIRNMALVSDEDRPTEALK